MCPGYWRNVTLSDRIPLIQQVNLYRDILRQGDAKVDINQYWLMLSAIVLLFFGYNGYLLWQVKSTETLVSVNANKLQAEQARVNAINAKIPKQELEAQLAAEVAQWQSMLDELTQTMQQLSGSSIGQSSGFSSYFLALSNQSIPEVWLTALYIKGQRQIINIEGSTFQPEKIPYFLKQLQKESVFNGHAFAQLVMQKSEALPEQMDFKLTTAPEAKDSKAHAQ